MRRRLRSHLLSASVMIHQLCLAFTSKGYVQTVAGGGAPHAGGKTDCFDADKLVDGVGSKARFSYPWGITFHNRTLYVGDCSCPEHTKPNENERIRKIDLQTGRVSTVAGGVSGFRDGPVKQAQFYHVSGIAVNPNADNIIYVVDSGNSRIRKVDLKLGVVSTFAGSEKSGFMDGIGNKAMFQNPQSIIFDTNNNRLYVGDTDNHAIRIVSPENGLVTTLTGGKRGFKDGHKKQSKFFHPTGLALDNLNQALYVADHYNHMIRVVDTQSGKVSTLAGGGRQGFRDGFGKAARFNYPEGIAYDPDYQVLYVVEFDNNAIRMVSLQGKVTTLAGGHQEGYLDGMGVAARFFHPTGLAFDTKEKIIYITDQYNHMIRSVSAKGHDGIGSQRYLLVNQNQGLSAIFIIVLALVVSLLLTRRCWKPFFSWPPRSAWVFHR